MYIHCKFTAIRYSVEKIGVDAMLVTWIYNYLTGRPQYVRLGGYRSETVVTNIGAPQGTVLSPFLFSLCTADFKHVSELCHVQKYSDDTAVVACIRGGDEGEYRDLVAAFTTWSRRKGLLLNALKTKEMIVDFRRLKRSHQPVIVDGQNIENVQSYKYLGVHLDNKLDWSVQTGTAYKKGQSRLYFLRKLKSFNVCNEFLHTFYHSVVSSAVFFGVFCWGSGITVRDRNRLDKLIRKCVSVMGGRVDSVDELVEKRMRCLMRSILSNIKHPLHGTLAAQRSRHSDRLLSLCCRTERFRRSFIPAGIRLFNTWGTLLEYGLCLCFVCTYCISYLFVLACCWTN